MPDENLPQHGQPEIVLSPTIHRPRGLYRSHKYATRLEQYQAKRARLIERNSRLPERQSSGLGYGWRPNGVTTVAAPRFPVQPGKIAFEVYYSWRRS